MINRALAWVRMIGITNDDALLDLTKWILSQKSYIKYIQPHHFCWDIFLFNHLTLQSDLELSVVANNGIIIPIARLPWPQFEAEGTCNPDIKGTTTPRREILACKREDYQKFSSEKIWTVRGDEVETPTKSFPTVASHYTSVEMETIHCADIDTAPIHWLGFSLSTVVARV